MAQDLQALRDEYLPQMPVYRLLARKVKKKLAESLSEIGLNPTITARCKDMRSLLKKCLLYDGPVSKVRDRAGVKVVARYAAEIQQIRDAIEQKFDIVSGPDVKSSSYKPEELGYLGTHYHVRLRPEDRPSKIGDDMECEVMLHTGAETLWDSISHQLIYKPFVDLPQDAKRSMMHLLVLVELFDKEVSAIRKEYTTMPEYETARMLDILEKQFYRLDPRPYQRDLSMKIIEALAPAVPKTKRERFESVMEEWVEKNRLALQTAYGQFLSPNSPEGVFLHQPESLLVFAMFSWYQVDDVKKAWLDLYSRETLEDLGKVWGTHIPR